MTPIEDLNPIMSETRKVEGGRSLCQRFEGSLVRGGGMIYLGLHPLKKGGRTICSLTLRMGQGGQKWEREKMKRKGGTLCEEK